jgi:hypothetical protein
MLGKPAVAKELYNPEVKGLWGGQPLVVMQVARFWKAVTPAAEYMATLNAHLPVQGQVVSPGVQL